MEGNILRNNIEIIKSSESQKFQQNDYFHLYKKHIFSHPDSVLIWRTIFNESLVIRRKYLYFTLILSFIISSMLGFTSKLASIISVGIIILIWIIVIPIYSFYNIKGFVDKFKWEYFSQEHIKAFYSPVSNGEMYQFIWKDQLIGMFCLRRISQKEIEMFKCETNIVMMENFIIRKDFQGKGLGSDFLKFAEKESIRLDYTYIGLTVVVWNDEARSFYKKRGFKCCGLEDNGLFVNTLDFWLKML